MGRRTGEPQKNGTMIARLPVGMLPDTMRRQVGQWLGNEATIGMVVLDREKGCERQNMKG